MNLHESPHTHLGRAARVTLGPPTQTQGLTTLLPSPELLAAFDIICNHVGRNWRQLARCLYLSHIHIEAIEERFPRNLLEQVREMLRVWKDTQKGDANVSKLVAALRTCEMNLVADLVEAGAEPTKARVASPGAPEPQDPSLPSHCRAPQ